MGLRTADPYLRHLIDACAAFVHLPSWHYRGMAFSPGEVLEGLILTESGGNPRAVRYEEHQDRVPDGDASCVDDGMLEDDRSYGLCQVMGYNLRAMCGVSNGTPMRFDWALLPITNIAFGLRLLLGELRETGDLESALARYNGGPTGDDIMPDTKDMRRREYVNTVAANAERAQKDRRLRGWAGV